MLVSVVVSCCLCFPMLVKLLLKCSSLCASDVSEIHFLSVFCCFRGDLAASPFRNRRMEKDLSVTPRPMENSPRSIE